MLRNELGVKGKSSVCEESAGLLPSVVNAVGHRGDVSDATAPADIPASSA